MPHPLPPRRVRPRPFGCVRCSGRCRTTSRASRLRPRAGSRPTSSRPTRTRSRRCRGRDRHRRGGEVGQPLPRHGGRRAARPDRAGARRRVGHIATGTGSVAVLAQVVQAACDAGDEVVLPWRSFEAYPIVDDARGGGLGEVGLDGEARHRLDAMAGGGHRRAPRWCSSARRTTRPARRCASDELRALPRPGPGDVARRVRRGLRRVRPRPGGRRRARSVGGSTRTSSCCGPSPRPTDSRACALAMPWRTPRSPLRSASSDAVRGQLGRAGSRRWRRSTPTTS